jgi:hypothetical protein
MQKHINVIRQIEQKAPQYYSVALAEMTANTGVENAMYGEESFWRTPEAWAANHADCPPDWDATWHDYLQVPTVIDDKAREVA